MVWSSQVDSLENIKFVSSVAATPCSSQNQAYLIHSSRLKCRSKNCKQEQEPTYLKLKSILTTKYPWFRLRYIELTISLLAYKELPLLGMDHFSVIWPISAFYTRITRRSATIDKQTQIHIRLT